jgi:ADP-ribose pyrophosphatase
MYKTISSRTLLTHPRLTVVEDTIELPDGQTGEYVRFAHQDAVSLIVRGADGRLLIQQEYSYVPNRRLYQLPGGGVEASETAERAARRELAEETGLAASCLTLLGSYFIDHRRSAGQMYVFLATNLAALAENEVRRDVYEVDLSHEWKTEREVADLIAGGSVMNVHFLAAWTLYRSSNSNCG